VTPRPQARASPAQPAVPVKPTVTSGARASLVARVYAELAQGEFRSGAHLARRLGVTRSAVWKAAAALRELGITVHAVRNRGYRLPDACGVLDAQRIRAELAPDVRPIVRRIETAWSLSSTNALLLERGPPPSGAADVLLAEHQSAGRGRRGRAWLAPPGGAICLSIGWTFAQLPRDLAALGLAVGVCALRALKPHVSAPLGLKWPNDLVLGARKLAGILIEMRAEAAGPTYVVIGIGVNVALGAPLRAQIAASGTQAIDLRSLGATAERNSLVAALIRAILLGLKDFERAGLRPFGEEWTAVDALRGNPVQVQTGEQTLRGTARGIDASGALLVETAQGLQRLVAGDVTVRPER